jgi:hypothetical protein
LLVDALARRGVHGVTDQRHVLVTLPDSTDTVQHRATYDAVRDAIASLDVPLLRLERRRGHLEDLFADATVQA